MRIFPNDELDGFDKVMATFLGLAILLLVVAFIVLCISTYGIALLVIPLLYGCYFIGRFFFRKIG